MTDNPFAAPIDDGPLWRPPPRERPTQKVAAKRFAIAGFFGGALTGSFGYLLLIAVIELLLVPPFKSPPNYGQFFIVVVGVAFYMSILGGLLFVVPYVSWKGYTPIHAIGLGAIWAMDRPFFAAVDCTEAPMAAMICLLCLPSFVAMVLSMYFQRVGHPDNATQ